MIADCETCDRKQVPCSSCQESQRAICFICQGDVADPYCELYTGIMWGPSIHSYISENKARIRRCEMSLVSLKNQNGEYAHDHRMLIQLYRDIDGLLSQHLAGALPPHSPPAECPARDG